MHFFAEIQRVSLSFSKFKVVRNSMRLKELRAVGTPCSSTIMPDNTTSQLKYICKGEYYLQLKDCSIRNIISKNMSPQLVHTLKVLIYHIYHSRYGGVLIFAIAIWSTYRVFLRTFPRFILYIMMHNCVLERNTGGL